MQNVYERTILNVFVNAYGHQMEFRFCFFSPVPYPPAITRQYASNHALHEFLLFFRQNRNTHIYIE